MKYTRGQRAEANRDQEVVKSPEGIMIPVAKRNRRGRKSQRSHSHPLRNIRLSRGLTLEELAEVSQLSPSYLSRLESGTRRLNIDTINRLAQALNCHPSALLAEEKPSAHQHLTSPEFLPTPANPHYTQPPGYAPAPGFQYAPTPARTMIPEAPRAELPIYGPTQPGGTIDFSRTMGSVSCPPDMLGVPGAFALRISDDAMAPRYRRGDCVLVNPGKPLAAGSAAVVITNTRDVIVGEFIAWRHVNDIAGFHEHPNEVVNPEVEYALELRQYNSIQRNQAVGSDSMASSDHQLIIHPTQISSVARIVGTIEG